MPAPDNESSQTSGIDWKAVARTFIFQVIVLLGLAGIVVGYVSWSSDVAFEEFVAASKQAVPDSNPNLQSATPVMTVKRKAACPHKG